VSIDSIAGGCQQKRNGGARQLNGSGGRSVKESDGQRRAHVQECGDAVNRACEACLAQSGDVVRVVVDVGGEGRVRRRGLWQRSAESEKCGKERYK